MFSNDVPFVSSTQNEKVDEFAIQQNEGHWIVNLYAEIW